MDDAHFFEVDEVLAQLGADPKQGLDSDSIEELRAKYGPNEMTPPESASFLKLILKQFEDLLVLILLGAAVVSFILGMLESPEDRLSAMVEPCVILIILIANATVGVIQETNAEKAIEKLKEMEADTASVLRDGKVFSVLPCELVPGDIVHFANGDKIPADLRCVQMVTASVTVDESALTGETLPVEKTLKKIGHKKTVVDQDKRNILFSSTLVTRGRGVGVVVLTGAKTSIGRIQHSLQEDDDARTPLQEKLDEFGAQLSKVILVICIVVWLINIGHFTDPEHGSTLKGAIYYFKIAVALAVAAIPEGLPAVVTTCLALGTRKMADKNAIVRSLPSVETLGCTTVICSDKTGTLTTNKMTVRRVFVTGESHSSLSEYSLAGDSWSPIGIISEGDSGAAVLHPASKPALSMMARVATLCNESHLVHSVDDTGAGIFSKTGESTEAALKVLAEKIGLSDRRKCKEIFASNDGAVRVSAVSDFHTLNSTKKWVLEFNRDRKSMSVVVDTDGHLQLLVKGAPEAILSRCSHVLGNDGEVQPLSNAHADRISKRFGEFASEGLRCIGIAYRDDPDHSEDEYRDMEQYEKIESGLTFVGVAGMLDPPRHEVRQSIDICRRAGIRVIVITGDNKQTAISICKQIGVFSANAGDVGDGALTGSEFMAMSKAQQQQAVLKTSLFARVEPSHKSLLVDLLQKNGAVVAMTGDGVNDAPALKKADIGVAMGSGTAVAREASDMVLQDDNFATIVMAVEEGRAIYANTKQFIRYLISSNIGEVACIFLTAAIGMPEALIPVQLLWVNLVTDGLPATALGFNKPDADIMRRHPRGRGEKIIDGWMFFRYMTIGLYIGVATVGGFIWWFMVYSGGPMITFEQLTSFSTCHTNTALFSGVDCDIFHDARPSTVSLSILVTVEMLNTFNALSENQSLLVVTPWANPFVLFAIILSFLLHAMILYLPFFNGIFSVAPLTVAEWIGVIWWSIPVIVLDEALKAITRSIDTELASKPKME